MSHYQHLSIKETGKYTEAFSGRERDKRNQSRTESKWRNKHPGTAYLLFPAVSLFLDARHQRKHINGLIREYCPKSFDVESLDSSFFAAFTNRSICVRVSICDGDLTLESTLSNVALELTIQVFNSAYPQNPISGSCKAYSSSVLADGRWTFFAASRLR